MNRRPQSSIAATLLGVLAVFALIEAPFRIYDHWFRFPQVREAATGNLGDVDFASIISYLMKTGRVVRDADLIWRHTPGTETYAFNSLGLRGSGEYDPTPASGTYRIIVFGGSQPFGLGVEMDEAYAAQLERILTRRCPLRSFEVINAAAPGHSTVQVANLFRKHLIHYAPDLVIIDAGFNDTIRLSRDYPLQDRDLVGMNPAAIRMLSLAERSAFFWYLRGWATALRGSLQPPAAAPDDEAAPRTRVSLEDTVANYRAIREAAAAAGIATLFLSQVELNLESMELRLLPMSHTVEPFLDIHTPLARSTDLRGDFADPVHTTTQGHAKIAGFLADHLLEHERICDGG